MGLSYHLLLLLHHLLFYNFIHTLLNHLKDEDGEFDYDNVVEDSEVLERIFDDVGNIDYIYQVIQECVDEVVQEQLQVN